MIGNPHGYKLRAIRHLLKRAFDAIELDALCLDYYSVVYQRFGPQMETDIKINLLLVHSLKSPTGLDELLKIVQNEQPDAFAEFELNFKSPNQEILTTHEHRELAETIVLLDKLEEWKIVHEVIQSILDKLASTIRYLEQCGLYGIDLKLLYKASRTFQGRCATLLRNFHKHNFYYARTHVLDSLREHFEFMDDIIRMMMDDMNQKIFNKIDKWFLELEALLWNALTEADNQIKNLVIILRQTMGM